MWNLLCGASGPLSAGNEELAKPVLPEKESSDSTTGGAVPPPTSLETDGEILCSRRALGT